MTLAEIHTMRQTCRTKVEDLLGRTASRELSTEETQMLADVKAEGERLASWNRGTWSWSRVTGLSILQSSARPSLHRPNRTVW